MIPWGTAIVFGCAIFILAFFISCAMTAHGMYENGELTIAKIKRHLLIRELERRQKADFLELKKRHKYDWEELKRKGA